MAERSIELGNLRIRLAEEDDAVSMLQSLMRYISNQEIADMLGISERTVRRWKREGRLPTGGKTRLKLADLIPYLTGSPHTTNGRAGARKNGKGRPAPATIST